jgi:hypothetical protein
MSDFTDSNIIKKTVNIFWIPWKNTLPSWVVVSNFKMPEPFNNCNTIEAVTISLPLLGCIIGGFS